MLTRLWVSISLASIRMSTISSRFDQDYDQLKFEPTITIIARCRLHDIVSRHVNLHIVAAFKEVHIANCNGVKLRLFSFHTSMGPGITFAIRMPRPLSNSVNEDRLLPIRCCEVRESNSWTLLFWSWKRYQIELAMTAHHHDKRELNTFLCWTDILPNTHTGDVGFSGGRYKLLYERTRH